jgi:hypothetical protein
MVFAADPSTLVVEPAEASAQACGERTPIVGLEVAIGSGFCAATVATAIKKVKIGKKRFSIMQLFYRIIAKRRAKIEKNDYMKFSSFLSIYLLRDSFILRKENLFNILLFRPQHYYYFF